MSEPDPTEQLDPHELVHIAIVGRKKSGKSELAWMFFESYPFDRVLVDPNGDLLVAGTAAEDLVSPVPSRFPAFGELERTDGAWDDVEDGTRPKRRTLRFVPDYLEPTAYEDIDRAVGLAFRPSTRTLLFVDECHVAAPAGQTRSKFPHMDRNLRQSRHGGLSLILVTPRATTIDPLVIAQADVIYMFKLPNPADRKRIAEIIGYDQKTLDDAFGDLARFEYLCYDHRTDELTHFPPLPKNLIVGHAPQ